MELVKIREHLMNGVKTYGLSDTVYDFGYRGVNHLTLLMVLKCLTIDAVDRKFLHIKNGYTCEFLDPEKLMVLSKNPEYQLKRNFLDEALDKGDECFAILDGDCLASYGWYSNKSTKVSDELELHFNERYVYMYNGFTHPDYRGQRLHAIGMTMALDHYLNRGHKGIVSWVEANNFSSLRSCHRMGYREFGEIHILKLFHKYFILCNKGCRDYGFNVSAIR
ncbi:MAG: GNAT family N-acetyltransferase [Blastocatellia bacterium]